MVGRVAHAKSSDPATPQNLKRALSASFPVSGFDLTLTGIPTLTSFQDFSFLTLATDLW